MGYSDEKGDIPKYPLCCSYRLILTFIGFLMFFHLYAHRIGMSVAIICMVNQTAVSEMGEDAHLNKTIINEHCEVEENRVEMKDGPFLYTKDIQGHILSSFFYGYLISQIPGGMLAEKFGGRLVMASAIGLSTFATIVTPIAAKLHLGLLIAVRVLAGIAGGICYPAMHAMWGQWSPPFERTILCGITYAGALMGNVVTLPVSGLLCIHGFSQGWDSIFYILGITSTITVIVWLIITSNTPHNNKFISVTEKSYILLTLKDEGMSHQASIPWKAVLTSPAVYAIAMANFAVDWGLYTYITSIPTFYKEVLNYDIASNGYFSALPFLALWATMNIVPPIADKLRSSGVLSTVATRKIFNTIGLVVQAFFLIGLSFLDCTQRGFAVALLVVAVSMTGFVYSGYLVNHMDIAPQFAGTLMGICNGFAAISGFVAPLVAALLTTAQTRESWQVVFFIAAAVQILGAIFFAIFARGEIQPWAKTLPNDGKVGTPMLTMENIDVKA